jgi:hypothetical protein
VTKVPLIVALQALVLAFGLAALASAAPNRSASETDVLPGRVMGLAADGRRAALVIPAHGGWRVLVWAPRTKRVSPIWTETDTDFGGGLTLAGSRAAWDEEGGGLTIETRVSSATLARRTPVSLGSGDTDGGGPGDEALAPHGDGQLVAFTLQVRCSDSGDEADCPPGRHYGDIVSATIWLAARRGVVCPSDSGADLRRAGRCVRLAAAKGQLTVLAVDANRIVARTDHGIRLLTGEGGRLRDFPLRGVRSAALSGNQLAVLMNGGVSVYDTTSGELVFREDGVKRLADLEHGILVTATSRKIILARFKSGRVMTIKTRGVPLAQLEPAGLFVAAGRRVTFTPMADVLRRLD